MSEVIPQSEENQTVAPENAPPLRILSLEDNTYDRKLLVRYVAAEKLRAEWIFAQNQAEFRQALANGGLDFILSDYTIPSYSGLAALEQAKLALPDVPFVFVTGTIGEERAVECLKSGATDYVFKNHLERLVPVIRRALRETELNRANKQSAENLRRLSDRLLLATRAARIGIWDADLVTGKVLWDEAMSQLYGIAPGSFAGTYEDWQKLVHAEDRARVAEELDLALRGEKDFDTEFRAIWPDGRIRDIKAVGLIQRDALGQPARMLGTNWDITNLKTLEAQSRRSQRLESIGQLAGGIAHDLNNILAPILMSAPLLRDEIKSKEGLSVLETLELSARRGADIVNQLLTFAKGIEGRHVLLQPRHVLKEVAYLVLETFPKSIRLETDFSQELWSICADSTQLHQLLLNLVVNARDAMPEGGRLRICARNFALDVDSARLLPGATPGPHVLIAISDTGTGISRDIAERVFDPFFTTKGPEKGTGLGLSTALGIVKSHRGAIQFSSTPGRGTEFRVYLPAKEGQSAENSASERDAPPSGKGELILLIDDETAVRSSTRRTLEAHGYTTLSAPNGAEGVDLYSRHKEKIALVITDFSMPSMGGAETIAALRKFDPALPIIVASGADLDQELLLYRDSPQTIRLSKPFDSALLLDTLHRALLDRPKA